MPLSPLIPFPTVVTLMSDFHAHMIKASLYATWKKANPKEGLALELYWAGGPYPSPKTEFGLALRDAYQAYRQGE